MTVRLPPTVASPLHVSVPTVASPLQVRAPIVYVAAVSSAILRYAVVYVSNNGALDDREH